MASQIGYVRWQQDYPDGADWFPLLFSSGAIRGGANRNYALLADSELDKLIAWAGAAWDPAERADRWARGGPGGARPRGVGALRQQRPHRHHLVAGG